jgi:hypothetical protein
VNDNTTTNRMGWMSCQNYGSVTIPAFAPMQVLDGFTNMGDTVLKVDMIGSSANPTFNRRIVFNREFPIPAKSGSQTGFGTCTYTQPCWAAYDTGTPSPGDVWGIKAGQFSLTKGGVGSFQIWRVNSTDKRILGVWEGITALLCTLGSGGATARSGSTDGTGTGTIQICPAGVNAATSWTTTVYNSTVSPVSQFLSDGISTKYVQAKYINGLPFIDVDDC